MVTCSYDYMTADFNHKSFVAYALMFHFIVPMVVIIYFYSSIVKAVVSHERTMKEQAKKMNVDSLRQGVSVVNSFKTMLLLLTNL